MKNTPLTPSDIKTPKMMTDVDVYSALYSWVMTFCSPQIDRDNIIRAWQNRAHPPANTNDMIVLTLISTARRGSNVEHNADDGEMTSSELMTCRMQVDCYSKDPETARSRAQALGHAARSSVGIRRFAQMGIGCNYASDARDMTAVNSAMQYLPRWTFEVQLSYTLTIEYQERTFTDIPGIYIENVDAHHPLPTPSDTPSSGDRESGDAPNNAKE